MLDNIKNVGSATTNRVTDKPNELKDSKDKAPVSSNNAVREDVELSEDGKRLESLTNTIMSTPEFDEAKVAEIRDAIARGEYKINYDRLADKMIDSFGGGDE